MTRERVISRDAASRWDYILRNTTGTVVPDLMRYMTLQMHIARLVRLLHCRLAIRGAGNVRPTIVSETAR